MALSCPRTTMCAHACGHTHTPTHTHGQASHSYSGPPSPVRTEQPRLSRGDWSKTEYREFCQTEHQALTHLHINLIRIAASTPSQQRHLVLSVWSLPPSKTLVHPQGRSWYHSHSQKEKLTHQELTVNTNEPQAGSGETREFEARNQTLNSCFHIPQLLPSLRRRL